MLLFITGEPGVGKSTLCNKVIERVGRNNCQGFLTREQRDSNSSGRRCGFEVVDVATGETLCQLASRVKGGQHRLGKYRVHVGEWEPVLCSLIEQRSATKLFVLDELGKMECMSARFVQCVKELLARDQCGDAPVVDVLATLSLRVSLAEQFNCTTGEVITCSMDNRESLCETICSRAALANVCAQVSATRKLAGGLFHHDVVIEDLIEKTEFLTVSSMQFSMKRPEGVTDSFVYSPQYGGYYEPSAMFLCLMVLKRRLPRDLHRRIISYICSPPYNKPSLLASAMQWLSNQFNATF